MIDWSTVFETARPRKGATAAQLAQFVATLGAPLTRPEVAWVNQSQANPFPPGDPLHAAYRPFDPAAWVMPAERPLPPSYLSFVRYSDGGSFQNGDQLFQMYGTGLRSMMLDRHIPQYMPLAVPFAFNGGGVMYMFDMREPPDADGEYPIICAAAGNLTFDPQDSPRVANSFLEVCRGRFRVERLRNGGVVLNADQWDVWTDPKPMLDECENRDRKLRLFACACARRVWPIMPSDLFRDAIELAEEFADVGLTLDKRRKALKNKCEAVNPRATWNSAAAAATNCLSSDASGAAWNGAWSAATAETGANEGRAFLTVRARQADLLREIFGNPLRPVAVEAAWLTWNNRTVPLLANRIYDERSYADLPVLADAVEEAGCANAELLAHLRATRGHVRGCWALDLLRSEPI